MEVKSQSTIKYRLEVMYRISIFKLHKVYNPKTLGQVKILPIIDLHFMVLAKLNPKYPEISYYINFVWNFLGRIKKWWKKSWNDDKPQWPIVKINNWLTIIVCFFIHYTPLLGQRLHFKFSRILITMGLSIFIFRLKNLHLIFQRSRL